jgi:glutaredoxin
MTFRRILPSERVSPRIQNAIKNFHPLIVEQVENAIAKNAVVVVGNRGNYFVKKARKNLQKWNVAYEYLEFGSYFSFWNERQTLKAWTGFSTFPMIFVNGVLIGGNSDLEAEKSDGTFDSRFK